jgi:hypothetical protein
MPLRKYLTALFVLLLASAPMYATTYYVTPFGNDSGPGTDPFFAWKTVAKVNQAALRSGDTVLFVRDWVWREPLIPQTSGVTYGAFGIGNPPVISGANWLLSGWVKAPGTNVWSNAIGVNVPNKVWFNQVAGTKVSSAADVLAPNQWYYGTVNGLGTLFVYSTQDLNQLLGALFANIEASQRSAAMIINNISNITVEHMAFADGGNVDVCLCGSGNTGVANFVYDTFSGAFQEAISIGSGNANISYSKLINNGLGLNVYGGGGFTLNQSIISGSAGTAVTVSQTTGPSAIENSTITGNATATPNAYILANNSSFALNVSTSVVLPNPYEPKVFNYYNITDEGNNAYQSPEFAKRAAPFIIVPFVDDYINLGVAQSVSALAKNYGCNISYALNTKLLTPAAWQAVAALQSSGDEIVAHTRSHSDLANNNVFSIQYTGAAATATMTVNQTTGRLQTFLNGSTTPDLNLDLTNTWNGVIDVLSLIPPTSPYTVVIQLNQNYFTPINLANVSTVNIKTAPYMEQAGPNYLTWEVEGAESDLAANLPGYKQQAFATPFTSSNLTVENHVRDAGFKSLRNGLLNADTSPDGNWLFSSLDVYNMGAEWLPFAYDATKPASSLGALVEGLGASGGVLAVYSHGYDEFSLQNWTDLFSNMKALGGTCMTMSQANAYVESHGTLVPDGTKKNWVQSVPLTPNYSRTASSPAVGANNPQD